jgi:uncharacterized protein
MAVSLIARCGGERRLLNQETSSNIPNVGSLQAPDANGVMLPTGFTSRVVARSGLAPMAGGSLWHPAPDGGACFGTSDGGWIYVSNSEVENAGGGVSALGFHSTGSVLSCLTICSGTTRNCAGGKTPWNTWLTCEESGDGGRIFECDPVGALAAVDRPALGRFNHEAVAFNGIDSRFYLTEDRPDGRLYRFTPTTSGSIASGLLEVARVAGTGPGGVVTWLLVPDPGGSATPTRFQVPTSTPFNRAEGIACFGPEVNFATTGDNRIWSYDVTTHTLVVVYDAGTSTTPMLTGIDNLDVSRGGDILAAEDGGNMQIVAITPAGSLVPIVQLIGHDASEIAGPAFDPSGTRLYFSSQRGTSGTPFGGITYEVSGPFIV